MPIFTLAEIETQVAAFKAALLALSTSQSYSLSTGTTTRVLTRANLPDIKETLIWLNQERAALVGGSSAPHGRTYARNGGRG